MHKHLWESKKKDIKRILDKEGIIINFRLPYFRFGKNLLQKQEKHGYGKIPQEEIQLLLEKHIKMGLDEKVLKQIIYLQ